MPDQEARDRRALKKAQTRQDVQRAAQTLFAQHSFDAVTVADIAAAADVAVQTVFNHFATKEDLYFADRAPWVLGPALAVIHRRAGTGAVATAHAWLLHHVSVVPVLLRRPTHRTFLEVVLASPSLQVHQRELFRRGEDLLADALLATWTAELGDMAGLRMAARMTSGLLTTGARVVLGEQWVELQHVPPGAPGLARLAADLRRSSEEGMESVGGGFPELANRAGVPPAFRAAAQLESGLSADLRAARSIRPARAPDPQESELVTTGSSTVSTRSVTSREVMGTANAV